MRREQVTAAPEAELDGRLEPLVRLRVERRRLARKPARHRRPPLLADAAGLYAGRTRADPAALEDGHSGAAALQLPGQREPDHACSDHRDVEQLHCA